MFNREVIMAKYSRMARYQQLRDSIEDDKSQAQAQVQTEDSERIDHQTNEQLFRTVSKRSSGPVMDNLLSEVKQYNIDQGTAEVDDTQINILKQLDGTQPQRRNQHFIPMEEQDDQLSHTINLTVNEQPQKEVVEELDIPQVNPAPRTNIVLGSDDVPQQDIYSKVEQEPEEDLAAIERERKKQARKAKKARRQAEQTARRNTMPSDTMKTVNVQDAKNQRTSKILNIILIVLIVLLVLSIAFVVYMLKNIGTL